MQQSMLEKGRPETWYAAMGSVELSRKRRINVQVGKQASPS